MARRVGCIFIGQSHLVLYCRIIIHHVVPLRVGRYFDTLAWRRCKFRGLRWVFFAGFVVRGGFCWHVVRILCLCSVSLFLLTIFWMKLQSGWCCGGETPERRGADFLFPFHRLMRCWHETVLMDGGLGWLWILAVMMVMMTMRLLMRLAKEHAAICTNGN
ncbi:hypothetical protein HDV62DRAFT_360513 [Trichoderma sp. SZMC 28011]